MNDTEQAPQEPAVTPAEGEEPAAEPETKEAEAPAAGETAEAEATPAEGEEPAEEDLDVPAFLRRQAD